MVIHANIGGNTILEFPDGTSPDIIDSTVQQHVASNNPGYLDRVGKDFSESMNKIGEVYANRDLNPASAGIQMLGAASSGAVTPITEAVKSGYNSLPGSITQPINNAVQSTGNAINNTYNSGINKLSNTDIGKSLGDYLMNSPHVQDTANEVSDDAKALANILAIAPTTSVVNTATKPLGDFLYNSGKAGEEAANNTFINKLITPKLTPSVLEERALNTRQINGKNIYQPTSQDIKMIDAIKSIPEVKASNSFQKNLNLIQDANNAEAEGLKIKLQANDVPINEDSILNGLQNIRNTLPNATSITSAGEPIIEKAVNAATTHLTNNYPLTASSVLQARKEFDNQILNEAPRTFDSAIDTPRTKAVTAIRNLMNNSISEAVPDIGVRQSLDRQSGMFNAIDNIAHKAAGEAATPLGRQIQKYTPTNLKELAKETGILGVGLTAVNTLPPEALAAALGGHQLYKVATSPTTRMLLGKALGGGQ